MPHARARFRGGLSRLQPRSIHKFRIPTIVYINKDTEKIFYLYLHILN
jgi:hypothetical protein